MSRKVFCPPLKKAAQIHVVDAESAQQVLDVFVGDLIQVQFTSDSYPGGLLSNLRFDGDDDCVRPMGSYHALLRGPEGQTICGQSLMVGIIEALSRGTATVIVTSIAEDGEDRGAIAVTLRVSELDP